MARPDAPRGSTTQSLVGLLILFVLAGIAATMVARQFAYVPTWSPQAGGAPPAPAISPTILAEAAPGRFIPQGLVEMTPAESFGPDTLSDKIDGRAELYLGAGFVMLRCQRFADTLDRNQWMEVFVYDMGSPENAYGVFSQQRRPDVKDSDVAQQAYATRNSLHVAHGKHYVEAVQAGQSPRMAEAMAAFARKFVAGVQAGKRKLAELDVFPRANLQAGSISRATEDQFGVEGLDNVYTAIYVIGGKQVTAFLSRRKSAQEAVELARAYQDYFLPFGGKVVASDSPVKGAKIVEIDGTYKCAFGQGSYLAGVHEAADRATTEAVAALLSEKLAEVGP